MGLIDAEVAAESAGSGIAGLGFALRRMKDRFDHLMAVYAAMVEAIDTKSARW